MLTKERVDALLCAHCTDSLEGLVEALAVENSRLKEDNVRLRFEVNDAYSAMRAAKKGYEDQARVSENYERENRELRALGVQDRPLSTQNGQQPHPKECD